MKLPPECTVPFIRDVRLRLIAAMPDRGNIEIDASDVQAADLSFVQLVVSASSSAVIAGQTLSLAGLPEAVRSLFLRAGLDVDPSGALPNA